MLWPFNKKKDGQKIIITLLLYTKTSINLNTLFLVISWLYQMLHYERNVYIKHNIHYVAVIIWLQQIVTT